MMTRRTARRGERMIQWIGVLIAIVGLAYNGVKDYQKGDIKLPKLPQKQVLTKPVYPIQYCLVAYDPNLNKFFYLHENGLWHEQPPALRRYATTPQHYQNQESYALGDASGASGASGYRVR